MIRVSFNGPGPLRHRILSHAALIALCLTTACASSQAGTSPRADRNTITMDQISERGFRNAYEAVEALRAPWLVIRPDGLNQHEVQVYLDNSRLGGIQALRQISAGQIATIRYIDAPTAMNRWGVDHSQGVIMVVSRR